MEFWVVAGAWGYIINPFNPELLQLYTLATSVVPPSFSFVNCS